MAHWTDEVILLELKQGHDKLTPFNELYTKYFTYLCIKAKEMVNDEQAAKDIVQGVFIEFYDKRLYDTIQTSVRACLLKQCTDRCLNYLRDRGRYEDRLANYGYYSFTHERASFTESFQIRDRLNDEISALPPQQQRAFELGFSQGKKYWEAAAVMGISINTFKNHYKSAMRRLRSGLADLL
jgi:RNA polymerase sigma-19 factor, ECF subfamily